MGAVKGVRLGAGETPPVVVVGLNCITGLQTARIFAERGVPVVGLLPDRRHWAARTRACEEVVEAPLSGPALVEALADLSRRWGSRRWVLVPCTDEAVHSLSQQRGELPEGMVLPLASHATVELLMDKVSFAEHASRLSLPVPRTTVLRSRDDAAAAAESHRFPSVIKPGTKAASWTARTSAKALTVHSGEELLQVYDRVASWAPVLLAQEWVDGPETDLCSCNAYFDSSGTPLATFVARKLRQWPPNVGTSASGEECRNDEVLQTCVELFGTAGFRGLAYLEMKRDARTGRWMIIEPNVGRPTGRSAIAEAGGVELLCTAYCDALGLPLPTARTQRYVGARWVDLRRDAQAAVVSRRQGTLRVTEWLRWLRGPKAHAIWSARDPMPFVVDVAQATRTGSRRLTRRGSDDSGEGRTAARTASNTPHDGLIGEVVTVTSPVGKEER
jgi:predicted ATP-grasp superfamily ATP-dependent carboligase